jgi:uncharacterized membrane protein YtjA (UPF0391 family)
LKAARVAACDGASPESAAARAFTRARRRVWVNETVSASPLAGCTVPHEDTAMLHYALVFLVIAIIAGVFGFGGIAGSAAGIAKILFVVFLVLAVIAFFRRAAK